MIAIITGVLLKGTFLHWLMVMMSGIYLGAPLAVLLGVWLIIGWKRDGQIPVRLKKVFSGSVVVAAALLLSLATGTAIHRWEIQKTRDYVSLMAPKLDRYRQEHGKFPPTLSEIETTAPPRLLSRPHSYTTGLNTFRFEYWDESGLMDGYYFDSETRRWSHFD